MRPKSREALGKDAEAKRFAASRDQFRDDLDASLRAAVERHRIDYLPGAAELGDFDATSTTIALAPGGEQARLPQALLHGTFERYWREFAQRRDGKREWDAYTPYEWRNVAAFVRLGWRERAWEAVRFFFDDRAPQPWNQWAEVVSRTPRKPFFVGDLPHAWVASDFVRSALDMFAYAREVDDSIVLAAGIPVDWLDGEGIAIGDLRTPDGRLGYNLRRDGGMLAARRRRGSRIACWRAGAAVALSRRRSWCDYHQRPARRMARWRIAHRNAAGESRDPNPVACAVRALAWTGVVRTAHATSQPGRKRWARAHPTLCLRVRSLPRYVRRSQ